ncbi:MAG: RecX family transcriptional regulator [Marinilabiliaceae bacterium]|nr:RecX family transcriptional regulator [Marinilabiliaceae bacterium]
MEKNIVLDYATALNKASLWCAQSEHCSSEVANKLKGYGLTDEEVAKGMEWLTSNRFVDDERYAIYYTRDKHRFSGWGPQKIRYQLLAKHISDTNINKALEELNDLNMGDKLLHILETKLRNTHQDDIWKLKNTLLRFAISRGYSYEESLETIEQLLKKRG